MPTLSHDDINQHYEIHGSGEPFLLHHGLTSNCQDWYRHLRWLTETQQVVLIDARGHGMSSAPASDEHYSWEIMAEDGHTEYINLSKAIQQLVLDQTVTSTVTNWKEENQMINRAVYTVKEVAELLGMSTYAVYLAIKHSDLPSIKVGKRYLVSKVQFEEMLADGPRRT